jgi:hypothetical protein
MPDSQVVLRERTSPSGQVTAYAQVVPASTVHAVFGTGSSQHVVVHVPESRGVAASSGVASDDFDEHAKPHAPIARTSAATVVLLMFLMFLMLLMSLRPG